MASTLETCFIMWLNSAVGRFPSFSNNTCNTSASLSRLNTYESWRHAMWSDSWGSSWRQNASKLPLIVHTYLPSVIHTDSQSNFNLVTALSAIQTSLPGAEKSSQGMPALASTSRQWLAQTAILIRIESSTMSAQPSLNRIPDSFIKSKHLGSKSKVALQGGYEVGNSI